MFIGNRDRAVPKGLLHSRRVRDPAAGFVCRRQRVGRATFEELPEHYKYESAIVFDTEGAGRVAYYFVPEGGTFRDYVGVVLAENVHGEGYTELLWTSYSGDALDEILAGLKTLHRE